MSRYLQNLRTRIGAGKQAEVLQLLLELTTEADSEYVNEIILLSSRLSGLEARERQGLADDDDERDKLQVTASILHLIDELEKDQTVLASVDTLFERHVEAGQAAYQAGKFAEALQHLEKALAYKDVSEVMALRDASLAELEKLDRRKERREVPPVADAEKAPPAEAADGKTRYGIYGLAALAVVVIVALLFWWHPWQEQEGFTDQPARADSTRTASGEERPGPAAPPAGGEEDRETRPTRPATGDVEYPAGKNRAVNLIRDRSTGRYGFATADGEVVLEPVYERARSFSDGLALVMRNGKWGYVDESGRWAISPRYDGGDDFRDGLARVQAGGKWGWLDRNGREVIPLQYESSTPFQNGYAEVVLEGRRMTIDARGNCVKGCEGTSTASGTGPFPGEDGTSFDPSGIRYVEDRRGSYTLVAGRIKLLGAPNLEEARQITALIRHYKLDKLCYAVRPDPSLTYLTVNGDLPEGAWSGEDCLPVDPAQVSAVESGGRWFIAGGRSRMLVCKSQAEADRIVAIIRHYKPTRICYIGRPDPSLTYLRR